MDRYAKFCQDKNLPNFRYTQITKGVYQDLASAYSEISTLPKTLIPELEAAFPLNKLTVLKEIGLEKGNTIKQLLQSAKGAVVESVLMRHDDGRNTVCVSSMSGCPVGCTFCATGQMRFRGNLDADEIVEQVLRYSRFLKKEGQTVTNVVFMGMGEPMLNLVAVKEAILILTDPKRMGLSMRRITVSTSGYIPQLAELIESGFKGRIAISLHAPTQELREELMPTVAKVYPLDKLMEKLDQFSEITNKRITYEYILISGVNDTREHASMLATLLRNRLAHVNLIPFNPVPGRNYKRPAKEDVIDFRDELLNAGIFATIRVTMGDDIDSACGQLASEDIRLA